MAKKPQLAADTRPWRDSSAKLFNLKAHSPDYDELLTETWQRIKAGS